MKRWSRKNSDYIQNDKIDKFIEDIKAVCKKHDLSISHEDCQGSFKIEPFSDDNIEWLQNATDDTEEES